MTGNRSIHITSASQLLIRSQEYASYAEVNLPHCPARSMVSVDPTSCPARQHAAGARKKPPRLPGKDARPGSTTLTRDSDAPRAA